MQITMQDNQLFVTGSSRFSARQTFTCGQCFRWTEQPDGSYLGIVRGLPARVSDQDGALVLSSDEQQFAQLWRGYFDCDTDYAAICDSFAVDAFTAAAADFGRGIRILRQEPWEALCTFILSQCNNIPRITGIVDRLCTLLGEPISFEQQTLYAFPSPEQLAICTPEDLASLRAGYRTPYLIAAAQAVCSGTVDFSALDDRFFELADLVTLWQVWIEIVFACENRKGGDVRTDSQPELDGFFDGTTVHDRQNPG